MTVTRNVAIVTSQSTNTEDGDMQSDSFIRGQQDGRMSAGFKNPVHNNWKRNKNNQCVHFNREYVEGYVQAYQEYSGMRPFCLHNVEIQRA